MPSPRLWRVDTPLVLITLLINVTVVKPCIGFCTGLLHSYITGGLGSLTIIVLVTIVHASFLPECFFFCQKTPQRHVMGELYIS